MRSQLAWLRPHTGPVQQRATDRFGADFMHQATTRTGANSEHQRSVVKGLNRTFPACQPIAGYLVDRSPSWKFLADRRSVQRDPGPSSRSMTTSTSSGSMTTSTSSLTRTSPLGSGPPTSPRWPPHRARLRDRLVLGGSMRSGTSCAATAPSRRPLTQAPRTLEPVPHPGRVMTRYPRRGATWPSAARRPYSWTCCTRVSPCRPPRSSPCSGTKGGTSRPPSSSSWREWSLTPSSSTRACREAPGRRRPLLRWTMAPPL